MKNRNKADVCIIGGGIVGLAIAYHAAKDGNKVVVFERSPQALGASIRNFGLLWPIGQPQGKLYNRAIRSRAIWDEVAEKASLWKHNNGSVHVAYHQDELNVLEEYYSTIKESHTSLEFLSKNQLIDRYPAIKANGLLGGIFSNTEATIDPREALIKIPLYLQQELGVIFRYETAISQIDFPQVTSHEETWEAERIYVCSGADFETLYPEVFKNSGIIKCKLQMMRTAPQKPDWRLGPTICGGLTLTHYGSFADCKSLATLRRRIEVENPEFIKWGIHVMITQNGLGELVIGDSHEYGLAPQPFDREDINEIILNYLQTFVQISDLKIAERWNGIYPKLKSGTDLIIQPQKGVTIVNGLGGAGMTQSFGLAEEVLKG